MVALVSCEPPAPQNQYLPPNQSPSNNYLPPTGQHGSGGFGGFGGQGHQQAPSSAYGAPGVTSAIFTSPQTSYGAPSQHGHAGGGDAGYSYGGGHQEENYGPAKYEFQYDVQDYHTGQDFGHMESRDGDKTVGRYYVLLPDGRKQIVQYEADEHGYRPVVSYEDTGAGQSGFGGGYDSNAQQQGKFNGY